MTTKKGFQDCPYCEVGEELQCENCTVENCLTKNQEYIAEVGY